MSGGAISNWERGDPISFENLSLMANKTGASFEWLRSGAGEGPQSRNDLSGAAQNGGSAAIGYGFREASAPAHEPPAGRATVNVGEEILVYGGAPVINAPYSYAVDEITGKVEKPRSMAGRGRIYALRVIGREMWPRLEEGEIVFIDEEQPIKSGDDVVFETFQQRHELGPRRYFRHFVGRDKEHYFFRQFTPEDKMSIRIADTRLIHRIIPHRELLGV